MIDVVNEGRGHPSGQHGGYVLYVIVQLVVDRLTYALPTTSADAVDHNVGHIGERQ